jgi:uncharacterized protein
MIHPDTILRIIDEEIGYGVFATRSIPRGTITWALDRFDQIFSPDQIEHFRPIHQQLIEKYAYRNRAGDYVLCWDFGRYVNHSFHSNCFSTGYDFEIAIRDIEAGEELTNDYGYLNVKESFTPRQESSSRSMVFPDDLLTYHKEWDEMIKQNFHLILEVDQPLLSLLSSNVVKEINETIEGKREMKSILTHYCRERKVPV